MKHIQFRLASVLMTGVMLSGLLVGCSIPASQPPAPPPVEESAEVLVLEDIFDDDVPLAAVNPVVTEPLTPTAPGTVTYGNQYATIDASNAGQGYVMIKYAAGETRRIKVQITKTGGTTYTYNLEGDGVYDVFPLSQENGEYKITIFRNVSDNKYAQMFTKSLNVTLDNQLIPFLYPNQYVDFAADSKVVAAAKELTASTTDELGKVSAVYNYVVKNFSYDYELAKTVQSGYLPKVDSVLEKKIGICFDYAAVMSAMLRSQGIPTKLVVGYTSTGEYHAWISVHISGSGWVNNAISFDGTSWKLMDPTFASTGKESKEIMDYINNPNNYSLKYCY